MKQVKTIGYWSGVAASVFSIIYSIFQILVVFKVMPAPWDIFWMFLPSLLLAVSFVILMSSVYYIAPDHKKVYALVGLSFAIIYCVLVSLVYFVELMIVIPAIFKGTQDQFSLLIPGPGSFLITVDALGYGFMSLSTLFAFAVFSGGKLEKWIRGAMLANGILTPFILFALIYPVLMFAGALWMITLPLSVVLITVYFRRLSAAQILITKQA